MSILVAAGFIVFQRDAKRFLAYSSVEHLGIITLGFGLGPLGTFAALFHTLNHSVCKSLAFFAVGRLGQQFGSHEMHRLSGALRADRLWGVALLGSILALIGVAPFSLFMSEYQLLRAAVAGGTWLVLVLFLAASSVVFLSALRHVIDMAFGDPSATEARAAAHDGTAGVVDCRVGHRPLAAARVVDAGVVLRCARKRRRRAEAPGVTRFLMTGNAAPVPTAQIPVADNVSFRRDILTAIGEGRRLLLLTGLSQDARGTRLLAALADDAAVRSASSRRIVAGSLSGADPRIAPPRITSSARSTSNGGVRPAGPPVAEAGALSAWRRGRRRDRFL